MRDSPTREGRARAWLTVVRRASNPNLVPRYHISWIEAGRVRYRATGWDEYEEREAKVALAAFRRGDEPVVKDARRERFGLDWEGALARAARGEPLRSFLGTGVYPTRNSWRDRKWRDPDFKARAAALPRQKRGRLSKREMRPAAYLTLGYPYGPPRPHPSWYIIDQRGRRKRRLSTGFKEAERGLAEAALLDHLNGRPVTRGAPHRRRAVVDQAWDAAVERVRRGDLLKSFLGQGDMPTSRQWVTRLKRDPPFKARVERARETVIIKAYEREGKNAARAARRSKIPEHVWDHLLAAVANSPTLNAVTDRPDMPCYVTVLNRTKADAAFKARLDAALAHGRAKHGWSNTYADEAFERALVALENGIPLKCIGKGSGQGRREGLPGERALMVRRRSDPRYDARVSAILAARPGRWSAAGALKANLDAIDAAMRRARVPEGIAGEVRSELIADVLEGYASIGDLAAAVRECVQRVRREEPDRWRSVSFDAPLYRDGAATLHDRFAA